jgi:hypothetical protein
MRSSVSLGSKTEKKQVNATEGFQLLYVPSQLGFEVIGVRLHRGKALHLAEKVRSEQSLKIANETETIVHSHWRQRVLSKNMQPSQQLIAIIRASYFAPDPMQCLSSSTSQQNDYKVAFLFGRCIFYLLQHCAPDSFFGQQYVGKDGVDWKRSQRLCRLGTIMAKPDVAADYSSG